MKCKSCNKETEHLEAHHIVPKSRGGSDDEGNLIKLCSDCHGLAHDVAFVSERGGLLNEAIVKSKIKDDIDKEWLTNNEDLINDKMWELYDKNEDEHMLILLLMERGRFTASHIRKWYENGRVTIKTSITFKD